MCETNVVNFFYNILKVENQVHFSELLERLRCSDSEEKTYFDSLPDYGRRWFFRANSSLFRISSDGYVSLMDRVKELVAPHTRKTFQEEYGEDESVAYRGEQLDDRSNYLSVENSSIEEVVTDVMVSTLLEHGTMHFLHLTKYGSGKAVDVAHYFEPLRLLEKFLFFKNRFDVFSTDDEGYVTLKIFSSNHFDEDKEMKTEIDQIADFFTSILRITHKMNHRKLVEYLQESNLDVKDYFASHSEYQLKQFFKKQASRFQLQFYSSVSLQDGEIGFVSSDEVEETKSVKERTSTNSNEDRSSQHRPKFEGENTLVKCFIYTLRDYGPMHYNALILLAKQKAIYFKQLSTLEKICFFKEYPDTFSIVNNRYVLLNDEFGGLIQQRKIKENQLIEYFVSILRSKHRMIRGDLLNQLRSSKLDQKNYFGKITGRKLKTFFKQHRSVFRIERDGFISLQKSPEEFDEGTKTSFEVDEVENTQIIRRGDACSIDEQGELNFTNACSYSKIVEETVIETLVSALLEYGSMHYLALLKCACVCQKQNKEYFEELCKDDAFFRNHPDIFRIGSDGYVTLTDLALNGVRPKVTVVLDYFTSILKTSPWLHPLTLVSKFKRSGLSVSNYFDYFSNTEIYNFFENHPSRFVLRHEITVSLPVEVMAYAEQELGYHSAERSGGLETARIKENIEVDCGINRHTHMENLEYCGKEENNNSKLEAQHILVADGNADCIFSCEKAHKVSSNCLEENTGCGFCSDQSTKSAATCSFKTADSKYDSKHDSFTFRKEGESHDRSLHKNEISGSLANDGEESPVMGNAFSASTTIENTATSSQLYTNNDSGYFSPRVARSIAKAESAVSEVTQKLDSTGVLHLTDILCLSDLHIQSIRNFVILLKDSEIAHYHQLLYKACSYDRNTFNFFTKFSLADVLVFIRMHSMYFSVQYDGNVILVDPSIAPNKILTSEDHILQVTSIIDAKAVEFFVNILRQRTKMALIELKFYLIFAPGYVLSFFWRNYQGEGFYKFFQYRPRYFHICEDEYVELISKILLAHANIE